MRIIDLETFRNAKRCRQPLWIVRWLAYVDTDKLMCLCPREHDHGFCEAVYTTEDEAAALFDSLTRPENVETVELSKIVYPRDGGYVLPLIREWADPAGRAAE